MVTTTASNDGSDRRAIAVGTEFVRQYYTVLNSNPNSVHRFYAGDSAFVYGGVDCPGLEQLPVRGQHNIHQRILAIGFKDPRCKILQIDSMFSEADCVLVQACGELSNDGGPMRRFMQSFLLKPKGEKSYCVMNSIFRYQDEVFGDDVDDAASSIVEEQRINIEIQSNSSVEKSNETVQDMTPTSNGNIETAPRHETVLNSAPESTILDKASNGDDNKNDSSYDNIKSSHFESETIADDITEITDEIVSSSANVDTKTTLPVITPQEPSKPKSWADLLSAKNARPAAALAKPNQTRRSVVQTTKQAYLQTDGEKKQAQRVARVTNGDNDITTNGDNHISALPSGSSNEVEIASEQQKSSNGSGDKLNSADNNNSFSKQHPSTRDYDAFQIFVGNLSPQLTENELFEFFKTFGEVDHVRINQGNANKSGARRDGSVPNFGFVIFRNHGTVSAVLNARPISIGDRRVNVEEKKVQQTAMERNGSRGGGNRGGAYYRNRGAGNRGAIVSGGFGGRGGGGAAAVVTAGNGQQN